MNKLSRESSCIHYWEIGEAFSLLPDQGRCRHCEETRTFQIVWQDMDMTEEEALRWKKKIRPTILGYSMEYVGEQRFL